MSVSKSVRTKTEEFIRKYINEWTSLPIDISNIIKEENIDVEYRNLSDELSGLLIIQGNSKLIGVEKTHHSVRQRFTLAHELGHFVLHNEVSSVFVDVQLFKRKSEGYSSREERMEQEANDFAASILMPDYFVRREVEKLNRDLHDDDNVYKLADIFKVSSAAMTYRLINLGLI